MWGSLGDYVTSVANSPCSPNGASSHAKLKQTYWLRRCEWECFWEGRPPWDLPCNSHRTFLSIVGQGSECEQAK